MNLSGFEACHKDLFTDIEKLKKIYNPETVQKIIRVRDMYATFLRTPSATDSVLIKTFVTKYRISKPTAYADLAVVKSLLPTLGKEARDFHQWRAKEMMLETYRMAAAKMDVRTMERIAADYARIFQVATPEDEAMPVDKIIVQPWIPTDDPSVLGLKPLPDRDKRIRELIDELSSKEPEILDIQFEEADITDLSDIDGSAFADPLIDDIT